jgi:ADP-ribose pyrophosphatase YjhB (NUDIX family)
VTVNHSVSVAGIVVRDDGRILAIKRQDNGQWQPPGGVLELAETLEEGVEREVLEETGVRVAVRRLTGVYKNMPLGVVALAYLCTPVSGTPTTSAEATAVQWMTRDQVREAMSPAFAIRVLDAFDEPAQSRSHDGVNLTPPDPAGHKLAVEAEPSGTEGNL